MAKGYRLALFSIASAKEIPFAIPQYVQCILYELTGVLLLLSFFYAKTRLQINVHCTVIVCIPSSSRYCIVYEMAIAIRLFTVFPTNAGGGFLGVTETPSL